MLRTTVLSSMALLAGPALADQPADDFGREDKNREAKDLLEGQAPPPLIAEGWLNTGGQPLRLEDLRGKVVVLDFWGTW